MTSEVKVTGPLGEEISAFNAMQENLVANHKGKFVIFKGSDLVGAYDTFDAAAKTAVETYGRGPYLIRQVGAPKPRLPASVMFRNLQPI